MITSLISLVFWAVHHKCLTSVKLSKSTSVRKLNMLKRWCPIKYIQAKVSSFEGADPNTGQTSKVSIWASLSQYKNLMVHHISLLNYIWEQHLNHKWWGYRLKHVWCWAHTRPVLEGLDINHYQTNSIVCCLVGCLLCCMVPQFSSAAHHDNTHTHHQLAIGPKLGMTT